MKEGKYLESYQDEILLRKLIREYARQESLNEIATVGIDTRNYTRTGLTLPKLAFQTIKSIFSLPGIVLLVGGGLLFAPTSTQFVLGSAFGYAKALGNVLKGVPNLIADPMSYGEFIKNAKKEFAEAKEDMNNLESGGIGKIDDYLDNIMIVLDTALNEEKLSKGKDQQNTIRFIKMMLGKEDPSLWSGKYKVNSTSGKFTLTDDTAKREGEIDGFIKKLFDNGKQKEAASVYKDVTSALGPDGIEKEKFQKEFSRYMKDINKKMTFSNFLKSAVKKQEKEDEKVPEDKKVAKDFLNILVKRPKKTEEKSK